MLVLYEIKRKKRLRVDDRILGEIKKNVTENSTQFSRMYAKHYYFRNDLEHKGEYPALVTLEIDLCLAMTLPPRDNFKKKDSMLFCYY